MVDGESREDDLSKCENFDDVLEIVGSKGRYQTFLLYGILCPIIAIQPIFTLNALFMLYEPKHWCRVPGRDNSTSMDDWKNLTIPREPGPDGIEAYSSCSMYGSQGAVIECQNGWDYDKTDYDITIPSQFDWVCDRGHYATDALTFYAIGNCIGTLVFGWMADKYGRKPITFLTIFINTFFRGVSLFVPQYFGVFLLFQLIIGTAFPIMYQSPSIIVAELSSTDYRGWIYAVTWMIWVIGLMSLPLIAWIIRNWFTIGIVTSAPGVLLFIYYWFLPESPRWLLNIGEVTRAAQIIENIALKNGNSHKINSHQLQSALRKIALNQSSVNKKSGVWTLFSKRRMAIYTILLTASWSLNGLIYYGVTLNASNMSGNQFLNFFLLAAIELPSGYVGGVLVEKTGRRWTQVAFFMVCAAAFVVAGICVCLHSANGLVIGAVLVGKFSVTLTFLIIYLQAAEIFPTDLRSTGSGFASTVASAVGILGPYLVYLGKYNAALPYWFITALSVIGFSVSAFLPETLHQCLPESMDQANQFGARVKFWSFLPPPEKSKCTSNGDVEVEKMQPVEKSHIVQVTGEP